MQEHCGRREAVGTHGRTVVDDLCIPLSEPHERREQNARRLVHLCKRRIRVYPVFEHTRRHVNPVGLAGDGVFQRRDETRVRVIVSFALLFVCVERVLCMIFCRARERQLKRATTTALDLEQEVSQSALD